MTLAILAGTGIGAAICLIASGVRPASVPLQEALGRLGQPKSEREAGATFDSRFGARLRRFGPVEFAVRSLQTDLRMLRRDPDEQAAEIAAYGLVGLFWAPVVHAGAWMLGIRIPWLVPAWLSLAGGVGAVVLAVRQLRTKARDARAAFGHALSAWCDVVAMSVSAGHELHAAIFDAADRGRGPAFTELRTALDRGYYAGEPPWDSLAQLGRELGVHDLVDISAALALAADEGAAIGETLTSKARSIRERLVAEMERKAASATERMAVPGAMILLGFLWLLAYPALHLIFEEAGR